MATAPTTHASMVFDLYEETEIRAELLDEKGIAAIVVKHADNVSFTCLKAFAYEDRHEFKDAHDLVYCIADQRDRRVLRQREASDIIDRLLRGVGLVR